jgi:hypothetical protein
LGNQVKLAADVGADNPQDRPNGDTDEYADCPNPHGDTGAIDETTQHIPAGLVGSQEVLAVRRGVNGAGVRLVWIMGRNERGKYGN